MAERVPRYLSGTEGLQPGDIIFFDMPKKPKTLRDKIGGFFLKAIQALVKRKHGHATTWHVAISGGEVLKKNTVITHVKGNYETVLQSGSQLNDDTFTAGPYWVYRAKSQPMRTQLVEVSGANQHNRIDPNKKKIVWSLWAGVQAFFAKLDPPPVQIATLEKTYKTYSQKTICSTFVAETINGAAYEVSKTEGTPFLSHYALPINSACTPKSLEACLYGQTEQYDFYCYSGVNPLVKIQQVMQEEVDRLKQRPGKKSQNKYLTTAATLTVLNKKLAEEKDQTPLYHSLALAQLMAPKLATHTKWYGLGQTQTESRMHQTLRDLGLFQRDVRALEVPDRLKPGLDEVKAEVESMLVQQAHASDRLLGQAI